MVAAQDPPTVSPHFPPIAEQQRGTREQWDACREDFVRGRGTYKQIAERHGVNWHGVKYHADEEGWRGIRSLWQASELARLRGESPAVARALEQSPEELERPGGSRWYGREVGRYRGEASRLAEHADGLHAMLTAAIAAGDAQAVDRITLSIDRMDERRRIILGQPLPPKLKDLSSGKPSAKPVIQVD